ncbi:hypothetical protein BST29_14400 [Mycobacterium malmoense]|uniref:Uncharacterized protein n=1 Tax=Mycobacterium malmoense TaxID=1780 RepID=A0ABX3SQG0_MYCMA|nr:hypothetical protein BST29_14400 [Mycobacterium malmoense]
MRTISVTRQDHAPVGIDDDVELLTEQIEGLKKLGQLEEVSGEEVYDLSIRWGAALAGRLPRLVHYSSLGQLDDADERRFQSLCDQLRTVSRLVDRFNLARPRLSVSPDARAGGRHHRRKRPKRRKRLVRR